MITIHNTQRKITIDTTKFKQDTQKLLDLLDYPDFDLGIWLTTDRTIREYNRNYRNKDKATDILSFSFHPKLQAGKRITVKTADDKNLGDLIISLEYVKRDADRLEVPFKNHLRRLLVHGV